MEEKWTKIYSSSDPLQMQIIQSHLEDHGIPAVISSKQDSMYPVLGDVELYTPREFVIRAINLIEKMKG